MLTSRTLFPTLLLLALLCASSHAVTLGNFDPDTMCSLLKNGTTIKDPRACNAWIECLEGKPISGTCSDDEFYDRETQQCVPSQSINCISSDPCAASAGTSGFVADPYSCNGYYYCQDGNGALGTCNSGMNFNPGTGDCIRNFPCVLKMDPDNYCNIVPDGEFIKNTANCNGWEMCWEGKVINGTCPGNFFYEPLEGICKYPQDVDCVEATSPTPNMPNADEVCTKVGDFVSDDISCNGYYYCAATKTGKGYQLEHGVCPDNRFFDPSNGGGCIDRTQITCEYDRCVGLGTNGIQLANEPNDDCRGYLICQHGVQIGSGTCPEDEYFDEVTQLCTTQLISFPACALSPETTTTEAINDDGDGDGDGEGVTATHAE